MKTKDFIKYFLSVTASLFVFANTIYAVSFGYTGGSTTTNITASYTWSVSSSPSWVSVSPSSGFGNSTLTITCSANSSPSSRSGTIVIGRSGQTSFAISVSQSGVPTYNVTATAGSGGSISPPYQTVLSGGTATFTASPNTGYYTSGCSGGTLSGNTVTVSNVTSNRSVSVSFTPYTYTVTASAGSGGSISPSSRTVSYGGSTTFTASPNTGYYTSGCSGGSLSGNTVTVSNVTSNSSVSVSFSQLTYTISGYIQDDYDANMISGVSIGGTSTTSYGYYSFTVPYGWSGTVTPTKSGYTFSPPSSTYNNVTSNQSGHSYSGFQMFTITTSSSPSGAGSTNGGGTFAKQSSLNVSATPNTGYQFVNWTENGTAVETSNPYMFTCWEPRNLVANFSPIQYTISTSSNPSGGGSTSGGGIKNYNSSVTVYASPSTGYEFLYWKEGSSIESYSTSYQFTCTGNRSLTAYFAPLQYAITTSSSPSSAGSPSGGGTKDYGSTVTLYANPNTGYQFNNWTENGTVVSTNNPYPFTCTGPRTLVANYSVIQLTISGYIQDDYDANMISGVSIGGTSTNSNGYYSFTVPYGWSGTVTPTKSGYTFSPPSSTYNNVTSNQSGHSYSGFQMFTITTSSSPSGAGSTNGGGTFAKQSSLNVSATPNTGYQFVNWTENGTAVETSNPYMFTCWEPRNLVANFSPIQYTITTSVQPWGSGTTDGGGTYNIGDIVTVRAFTNYYPEQNTKTVFKEWWQGGTVVSTDSVYQFPATANRSLTAIFGMEKPIQITGVNPSDPIYTNTPVSLNFFAYDAGDISIRLDGNEIGYLQLYEGSGSRLFGTLSEGQHVLSIYMPPSEDYYSTGSDSITINVLPQQFTITTGVQPFGRGTTDGGGTYSAGDTVTVRAFATYWTVFKEWWQGGTVVSTDSVYQFTATADKSLTAIFGLKKPVEITGTTPSDSLLTGSPIILNFIAYDEGNLSIRLDSNEVRYLEAYEGGGSYTFDSLSVGQHVLSIYMPPSEDFYSTGSDSIIVNVVKGAWQTLPSGAIYFKGGSIGIGLDTPNPLYKLDVNGKTHAASIIVDLNFPQPDYVFDTNYNLMPLNEVETFIKTHKHLHGIPSAKEVKQKGIKLGEMQAKLLQKVEELTLYLIDINKESNFIKKYLDKIETNSSNNNNHNIK